MLFSKLSIIKQSIVFKSRIIPSSTFLASINFILLIFFSKIFAKCVFPDPGAPKIFSHFPGHVGHSSINLYAEKLLLDTKKSCL